MTDGAWVFLGLVIVAFAVRGVKQAIRTLTLLLDRQLSSSRLERVNRDNWDLSEVHPSFDPDDTEPVEPKAFKLTDEGVPRLEV